MYYGSGRVAEEELNEFLFSSDEVAVRISQYQHQKKCIIEWCSIEWRKTKTKLIEKQLKTAQLSHGGTIHILNLPCIVLEHPWRSEYEPQNQVSSLPTENKHSRRNNVTLRTVPNEI